MIIRRKPLDRRTFLRGTAVAIGLPFLDIMRPSESFAQSITRTAFVYSPNGWYRETDEFFPSQAGSNYSTPSLLAPLDAYKDKFTVISNLSNQGGRPNGDGAGDHARAGGSYLTSVKLLKNSSQVNGGQSIDRHIAAQTGLATPIDMLLMGNGGNDGGDSGYNSLNMRLSWRSPTEPVHWENDLQDVFDRLVGSNTSSSTTSDSDRRRAMRQSVLDQVINDDLPRLRNQLGQEDRLKLDSYLTGLRDVERQIDNAAVIAGSGGSCNLGNFNNPGSDIADRTSLMFDLMINAFECDLTRVAVIGIAREATNIRPDGLNLGDGWHTTSHYSGDNNKIAGYERLGNWVSERAADLMQKLDNSGLLDSSLVSFGAGTGGNRSQAHGDDNLPTLLMGTANGAVRTGRHLRLSNATQIANLWAAMAYHAGAPVQNDRWGQYGTGRLDLS